MGFRLGGYTIEMHQTDDEYCRLCGIRSSACVNWGWRECGGGQIYWIYLKGVKLLDDGVCCGFMDYSPALESGKIVVI